jgi:hypothetical protein
VEVAAIQAEVAAIRAEMVSGNLTRAAAKVSLAALQQSMKQLQQLQKELQQDIQQEEAAQATLTSSRTEPHQPPSADASPMSVVIKGLPADHSLSGCMGVYRQRVQGNNHQPAFVGGRCDDMVLYFSKDGWFVTHHDVYWCPQPSTDVMLWSASIVALPHLTKSSWVVFDHTKVPAPCFGIKKFKNQETMLEVKGGKDNIFGEMVAAKYTKDTGIHNEKPKYTCDKLSKAIWFEEGFGWCIGDEACIGTRICLFHANDFALTPDAVQSSWMVQVDPVADPRVQVVLASAELSTCSASIDEPRPAGNAALQVAVIGSDGCDGRYEKTQHTAGGRVVYERTTADGSCVVWYDMDDGEWRIGPKGNNGCYGCIAFAAESESASSPLASEMTWYEPACGPYSSIRVTKSRKKHTKVIEVKGVPTDELALALLNGKYRQQARVVDGKPTFKGGQDSNHVIWYSERAGEWRIGEACFVGTSAHVMHAEDTAATPNTVKATWYAPLGTTDRYNPFIKVVLPSVEAAEQEVPRQMQLKVPEVMASEEKRCLGCGHQYTSLVEVVFHEECMHHHCVCCQEGLGGAECAVCMEE